ncbi:MAG: type II toxin-antitoxin system PemK/MazF family toxin [Candidatus Aminicenantes bacterium]|nr:type II toxin-antitoxin system PemK/MazF family toxin [Candidatus Aminicenantes bacterium]
MSKFRWHIFLANLDPVVGSEQGRTRPVLVISEDEINRILPVVNVIPLTSMKEGRKIYPNEVFLTSNVTGLSKNSIALCYQIRTLDKKRFIKKIGEVSDEEAREEIRDTICFQLGI